ncbi:MAG: TldD/PmbA family protein [Chloroflexi bacterium]|nr:TldD/PmbA family protein [Chloroflexota bacterium]
MLEQLLERARREADEAEVFWIEGVETPVAFEANRLKLVESKETSGVALRIIKGGRTGFSSTTDLRDVERLVQQALETIPFGPKAYASLPGVQESPLVKVYDEAVEHFPIEKMAHLGQSLLDSLHQRWAQVTWDGQVAKSVMTVRILNTRGLDVSYRKTVFSVAFEGTLIKDTDMLFVWEGDSSCRPIEELSGIRKGLEEQLELGQRVVAAPEGQVPVVFTQRGILGALLYPLLTGFNGHSVALGASPLIGKLGQRLFDPRLSLWDDPTMEMIAGSRAFDDEGTPTERVCLVDEGVAGTFLFDLQTAGQVGAKNTGSAHRTLGSLPSPGASVILMKQGNVPYGDLISGLKKALVVERVLGAGQGNVMGGEFSGNVLLGYRVEDGRIIGRVKDTMISGNVYKVLSSLLALTKESRWVGGYFCGPALCTDAVSISSKGKGS